MLATYQFRGSHTGEAIKEEFQKAMASFEVSSRVSFTVTNSAANMLKAFSLPGLEILSIEDSSDSEDECGDTTYSSLEDKLLLEDRDEIYEDLCEISQHVHCFAQTLQHVIKDGFKQAGSINKVFSKVSVIVSHVKKSIHVAEVLESKRSV